jgi:hypothetical protein
MKAPHGAEELEFVEIRIVAALTIEEWLPLSQSLRAFVSVNGVDIFEGRLFDLPGDPQTEPYRIGLRYPIKEDDVLEARLEAIEGHARLEGPFSIHAVMVISGSVVLDSGQTIKAPSFAVQEIETPRSKGKTNQ